MSATDEELAGMTLAQLIENHGPTPCGSRSCKIEAAQEFVKQTKKLENPWVEVIALHVHTSMLDDALSAARENATGIRQHFGLFIFDLVHRLGGLVFLPPFAEIQAKPGVLDIQSAADGSHSIKIVPETSTKRRKRLH